MKIKDLIGILKDFPQDSLVALTYESVVMPLEPDDIYKSEDGVILIGNGYKDDFVSGALSAREFINDRSGNH